MKLIVKLHCLHPPCHRKNYFRQRVCSTSQVHWYNTIQEVQHLYNKKIRGRDGCRHMRPASPRLIKVRIVTWFRSYGCAYLQLYLHTIHRICPALCSRPPCVHTRSIRSRIANGKAAATTNTSSIGLNSNPTLILSAPELWQILILSSATISIFLFLSSLTVPSPTSLQ